MTITDEALQAAARPVGALHHRPLPAGQGDRPDRRGGFARAPAAIVRARRPMLQEAAAGPRQHHARRRTPPSTAQQYEHGGRPARARRSQLREKIETLGSRVAAREQSQSRARRSTEEDIAEVVAMWTGIPVTQHRPGGVASGCSTWKTILHRRVIGQDEAIVTISKAVRRARAGLKDPQAPDRHLHLPRPDRRRQDRAGEGAGRVHVRQRGRADPDRHVRVHGAAHRVAGWSARRPATSATTRAAS